MTIFFVSIEFNYCCGVSQSVFSLARELKQRGHKIILGAPGGTMVNDFINSGMDFVPIPILQKQKNLKNSLSSVTKIWKVIKKYKVDILHSHNRLADFFSYVASLPGSTPTVISAHALVEGKKMLSFRSDKIIAVSNAVNKMLIEDFKVKTDSIAFVRNIPRKLRVPLAEEIVEYRRSLNLSEDDIIVAGIGRLHPEKGFDILLQALTYYKNDGIKTVIVGKGQEKETMQAYVKENALAVTFIDETKDIELIYALADIIVVPSRQESAGLVAVEAGFFKRPVIATSVGGLGETIKDNVTGILVESENAAQIGEAIRRLVEDRELARKIGEQLNSYVTTEYGSSYITDTIESIYKQLITANGSRDHS